MDSITFNLLAKKLTSKIYTLTKEQQQILDNQINSDKSTYTADETLFLT